MVVTAVKAGCGCMNGGDRGERYSSPHPMLGCRLQTVLAAVNGGGSVVDGDGCEGRL